MEISKFKTSRINMHGIMLLHWLSGVILTIMDTLKKMELCPYNYYTLDDFLHFYAFEKKIMIFFHWMILPIKFELQQEMLDKTWNLRINSFFFLVEISFKLEKIKYSPSVCYFVADFFPILFIIMVVTHIVVELW